MTDRSTGFRALGTLLAVLLFMPVLVAPAAADTVDLSADRYGTAARAALYAFPEGADAVVVASGEVFADALAAGPLAAAFDAPILLTTRDAVPEATGQALEQLGVEEILLLGGEAAVSTTVSNALFDFGHVTRVAGEDRYETAARAALEAFAEGAGTAVVASGEGFADALAAAPLAAARRFDAPILLTGQKELPTATADALEELGVEETLLMGGEAAVSTTVSNALFDFGHPTRVAGEDRYQTAARAALEAFHEGSGVAVLASGEAFADALAAAPLAAAYDAPILLTGHAQLSEYTTATLAELGVADVLVMGGAEAVSHDVTNALHADYQVVRIAGG